MPEAAHEPRSSPHETDTAWPATPSAEEAVAPGPAIAGLGVRPGASGVARAAMQALQRSAGNAAVQRLSIQRVGGAYAPGRITVDNHNPTVEGASNWARKGADTIDVNGPKITLQSNAKIDATTEDEWKEMDVGPQILVGPTQSVTGSLRTGVYREGTTGPVTATKNMATGSSRDAQWDREKNKQVAAVPAPWYSQPTGLSAKISSAQVTFYDNPGFDLPLKMGKGTLAEIKGSDNFITSFAAKTEKGQLDHLFQFSWSAPWDMTITPDQSGTGSRTGVTPTDQIPPTLEGPIAVQNAATWLAFTTVEQAEAAGAEALLRYLGPAAQHDPAAAATIRLALKKLDPTISVRCAAEKTGNVALDMRLAVVARGDKTKEYGDKLTMDAGGSGTATFKLSELFDIDSMGGPAKIYVTLKKYGRLFGNEGEVTFPGADPPYSGATDTKMVGGAKVTVTFGLS